MTDGPSDPVPASFTALLNGLPVLPEYLERFMASQQEPVYCTAGGEELARLRYRAGEDGDPASATCADCGAGEGQLHTIHCSLEECPVCLKQAIVCDCDSFPGGFATPADLAPRT